MFIKNIVKQLIATTYYLSGKYKNIHKGKVIILMYHRVLPKSIVKKMIIQPGMYVTEDTFKMHLEFLERHYEIISFKELLNFEKYINEEKQYCIITFDDGWKDNFDYAYPHLKKHNLPATIFLPVNFIDTTKQFWPENLAFLLQAVFEDKLNIDDFKDLIPLDVVKKIHSFKNNKKNEYFDLIVKKLKEKNDSEIIKPIDKLKNKVKCKNNNRVFVKWTEIEDMSKNNISFGSHGMSHKRLNLQSQNDYVYEIQNSKKNLEKKNIAFSPIFCYPNGNYTGSISDCVKANDYKAAFTTRYGLIDNNLNDIMYTLPRIGVHNDISNNISKFALHISGLLK